MSEDYIDTYSRADAHADGVLIDLTSVRQRLPKGTWPFKIPASMSLSLWASAVSAEYTQGADLGLEGVANARALVIDAAREASRQGGNRATFQVRTLEDIQREALILLHPGDDGEMVITLMYPEDE